MDPWRTEFVVTSESVTPAVCNEDDDDEVEANELSDGSVSSDWRPVCGRYRVASRYA